MFRIPQPPLVGRRRRLSRWRLPPSLSLNLPLVCPFRLFPRRPLARHLDGSPKLSSFLESVGQKCGAEVWGSRMGGGPPSQEEPRGTDPCETRKKRLSEPATQETPTRDRCRSVDRLVLCFGRCVVDAPRARARSRAGSVGGSLHWIGLDAKSVREKTEIKKSCGFRG